MSNIAGEYDVMFLHVHKQHIYEPIAGAVAAGLKTAFVTPLYNRGLTKLVFGGAPGPVGRMVRQHADERLAGADIHSGFPWSLARLFVNYAWRREESRFFKAFDRWCAARIRKGRFRSRIFYVFQDYLPRTCLAVKEAGALLVAEQILNNSRAAQQRVIDSTRQVSFPVHCPEYPSDQSVNERLLGLANRVVVPSSYVRRDIEDSAGPDKIWQVPYGAQPATVQRSRGASNGASIAASDGARSILVAVWASSVRKGGHLLLEALLRDSADDLFPGYAGQVEFLLLGNLDPQFLPAVEMVHSSCPRVKVTHGYIPHAAVAGRLAGADFFMCPSLSEGMSLAMLEAAAAGLPLVITPFCGLDAFVNGVHGVLIGEPSPGGVARSIREMFLQRTKWPDFGRAAQGIINAHPWSEFGRQIGANLRSLLP
jgi:glycosyltransferase involved in cell wall biosynthesis